MRLRIAVSVIAFYMLTSAATAYAECAWVVWIENSWVGQNTPATEWVVVEAYPGHQDCQKAQAGKINTLAEKDDEYATRTVHGNIVAIRYKVTGNYNNLRVVCLPDTIDPHGPKGGK